MKIIKYLAIALLTLLVGVLVVGLFLPKQMSSERSIIINKPQEEVFNYLVLLKHHGEFSKWAEMDPNAVNTYRGTDGEVGFVHAWKGDPETVGEGEQEIVEIVPMSKISYALRFKTPFESEASATFTIEAAENNQTRVVWGFSGDTPYPFNVLTKMMNMEGEIGKDYEYGLNKLKARLES